MTTQYKWVQWNRHKIIFDIVLAATVVGYIAVFVSIGRLAYPPPGDIAVPVLLMRAASTLAIVLLHIILLVGPLSRVTSLAAPLLYNRRHLGVTFFLVAAMHGALAIMVYGGFGVRNPLSAVVSGYDSFASISGFPFEVLGLFALLIFFVMAATSHDFWLHNLSHRTWKSIHMLVYPAYALILMHVVFGVLQSELSPVYVMLITIGAGSIVGAHLAAGLKEWSKDARGVAEAETWIDVASVSEIQDGRAKVVCLRGAERVAVFRHGDSLSAVSNVCAHQGGPLGEGRIVDGCITCPWHGYQYHAHNGSSPPPFTEKIPTYEVRISGDRIELNTVAHAPGTALPPAPIPAGPATPMPKEPGHA